MLINDLDVSQLLKMYPEILESSNLPSVIGDISTKYQKSALVLERYGKNITKRFYFAPSDDIGVVYIYLKYKSPAIISEIKKVISKQNEETK